MTPWQHPLGPGQIFSSEGFFEQPRTNYGQLVLWRYFNNYGLSASSVSTPVKAGQLITIRTSKNQQQSEAEETIWRG